MKILTVTIIDGPHKGETFFLNNNSSLLIGRHDAAGIKLDQDCRSSRKHAIIGLRDNTGYVLDLHSTNGTFVNNRQVVKRESLQSGDVVFLGRTYLKIFIQDTEKG